MEYWSIGGQNVTDAVKFTLIILDSMNLFIDKIKLNLEITKRVFYFKGAVIISLIN